MQTLQYNSASRIIFLSLAGSALSLFIVAGMKYYQPQNRVVSAIPITVEDPAPTTIPEQETVVSQTSSDGTKKLIMKTVSDKNTTKTYVFFTSDGTGENSQMIFKKTLDAEKSMTIPFNTWSPDNKYFFLQEEGEENSVLVFNSSGEPFANQEKYLDVTDLFRKSGNKNNFKEATGWASENLIVFTTTTQEGIVGPSYWFEVPSKAIIQLSLQF